MTILYDLLIDEEKISLKDSFYLINNNFHNILTIEVKNLTIKQLSDIYTFLIIKDNIPDGYLYITVINILNERCIQKTGKPIEM